MTVRCVPVGSAMVLHLEAVGALRNLPRRSWEHILRDLRSPRFVMGPPFVPTPRGILEVEKVRSCLSCGVLSGDGPLAYRDVSLSMPQALSERGQ